MDLSSFAREGFQDGYAQLPYVLEITPNCFRALRYGLKSPKSEDDSQYTTNCTERNIFPIKPRGGSEIWVGSGILETCVQSDSILHASRDHWTYQCHGTFE
jgi:hypothetical protein